MNLIISKVRGVNAVNLCEYERKTKYATKILAIFAYFNTDITFSSIRNGLVI